MSVTLPHASHHSVLVPDRDSDRGTAKRIPRRARRRRPLVMGERLFREVLVRERKRADRFNETFVLVTVSTVRAYTPARSSWAEVVAAIAKINKRDADVLGWLVLNSSLGLLVPEIESAGASRVSNFESAIRAVLAGFDEDTRAAFSIHVHRHGVAVPSERHLSVSQAVRAGLKRALDIVGSATLLFMLSPLFAVIAALVKLKSPGPVLFKQVRIGESGEPFTMLKFRTMQVNNDAGIHQAFVSQFIKTGSPAGGGASSDSPFKIANDPRVTPIGRFLRRSSLDEVPQFWNVLRGDMSLVGPRPPLRYEVENYKPWHFRRVLEAKPGITGLWQVYGRSRTTFEEMVRLDLRYAKNPSAWTDIKILLATPRAVISGKGAG